MCRRISNIENRNATGDEVDSGKQQVDVSVCVSAHTHCGLVMLLQNRGDVAGLLLFLLCVVLDQWQPVGSPATGFLSRLT